MANEKVVYLLGRAIEELEDAIEFYNDNEEDSYDPEEAELARERKEFLLDDLVRLRTELNV